MFTHASNNLKNSQLFQNIGAFSTHHIFIQKHRNAIRCQSGFGADGSTRSTKKAPRLSKLLGDDVRATPSDENGWFEVPDVDATTSFISKPIKPVILATGRAICLYKVGETIYCSDANSTAYKYPLADANLIQTKTGPAVECKLDGCVYDLATGKVLTWCPKNNPIRSFLGSLKDKTVPIDLPVFPVRIEGKKIFINLTQQ